MAHIKLKDKWALVTGSSRGIGQQISLGLAQEGCNVIIHGRTKDHTQKTKTLLQQFPVAVDCVEGDLACVDGVNQLIKTVFEKHHRIDILYNNAGIMNRWTPILEIPLQDWMDVFQVNFYSMILLCNAFIPGMKQGGYGRVINVSSGIKDTPNLACYSVSKAAVDKYTRDLAFDLKGTGVLVNALDPGWLKTDMGGPNADYEVTTVLPGAIVPALFDNDGPSGECFRAQEYKK